jgi:hypothetical protein
MLFTIMVVIMLIVILPSVFLGLFLHPGFLFMLFLLFLLVPFFLGRTA